MVLLIKISSQKHLNNNGYDSFLKTRRKKNNDYKKLFSVLCVYGNIGEMLVLVLVKRGPILF